MFNFGGKKVDPKEQVKHWKREMQSEQRGIDRQIRRASTLATLWRACRR